MNKPFCGIYEIVNNINQHCYVGQSVNIYQRWNAHRSIAFNKKSKGYNRPLYCAIRKYGLENFSFKIIEECPPEKLNEREIYWIAEIEPEYNLAAGGDGSGSTSKKLTIQQVKEIQAILIADVNGQVSHRDLAEKYGVLAKGAIRDINVGRSWYNPNFTYPLHKPKFWFGQKHLCCDCGKIISKEALRCPACANIQRRKSIRPNREELKKLIRNESFLSIGKQFNVSDNAIRKWCIAYNLPSRKEDINKYTNEEWLKI